MTTLLLVRHGETLWNTEERVQGHGNSALSERGKRQVEALAARLVTMRIDAVYSSDLQRALDSIEPFARISGADVVTAPALREKCFGEWEGLRSCDLEERYPELWHRYHTLRDIHTAIPGGETWEQVAERTIGFLKSIVCRHASDSTVLIVGHGGALRPPILHALNAPLASLTRLSVDNTGINKLRFQDPDNGRVISLNDCNHLEGTQ